MPLVLVFFSLISTALLAQNLPAKISLPIRAEQLQESLVQVPCSTPVAAELCRQWAWTFRKDEGIYDNGQMAIIVFRTTPPESLPEEMNILKSLSKDRWLESYALLMLSSERFIRGVELSPPNMFLVILRDSEKYQTKAALLVSKNGLSNFLSTSKAWREEAASKTLWFIPHDFTPFYQFETF